MKRRTALGDLIFIIGGIALAMVLATAGTSYALISVNLRKSLMEASERTAKAIARSLEMPLNLVSGEMALGVAKAYLASGKSAGIRIESDELGVIIDKPPEYPNSLPPVDAEVSVNGRALGRIRLWFDDGALENAQRGLLIASLAMLLGILAAYAASILLIVKGIVARPFNELMAGIEAVGSGEYGKKIPSGRHADLNALVDAFNRMSDNIQRSEELLQMSERRYGAVFDTSFAAILLHDGEGRIVDVNESMLSMFGVEGKEEAIRYDLRRDYSSPESDAAFLEAAWKDALSGKDRFFPWIARRPLDASTFPAEMSLRRIELGSGPLVLASMMDVTERKKIEEQLIQAQKMEAIGTIAGGLAHDFNNILGGITGTTSVLQFILDRGDEMGRDILVKALDTIQDASFRAANVVGKLLTLTKGRHHEAGIVDMRETITRVMAIAENAIDKSVDVEVEFPESSVRVMGDRTQLEQVVLNLIVNAAHSMTMMRPKGERWGGKLRIALEAYELGEEESRFHPDSRPGSYAVLRVSDSGIGIGRGDMERIFLPFFTTKEKGSGLGLSIVYSIVKAHEGFIVVESEAGKGTDIRIFLPRTEALPEATPPSRPGADQWKGEGSILVIDDEKALREGLQGMLEQCGYAVIAAPDGEAGLRAFKERKDPFALVFLDMSMPRLSGREAFRGIKEADPGARIILMSGYRQDERVVEIMEEGVAGFLQKPFDRASLMAMIRSATGG